MPPSLWTTAIVLTVWAATAADGIDPSQCIAPLGMENGLIKDADITASSSFDNGNVGPQHGRIRTERNGGAWCPQYPATQEPGEWLQVDFHNVNVITATGTQGRFGNGQGVEFTEAYMLEYWRPRLNKWIRYHDVRGEEVFEGNMNTYLESKTDLNPPIWASKIRFYPYSHHSRTVCMRVEIYGCKWSDGIVSYSMPQGDKRGSAYEFYDTSYDGHWDGDELRHGLGQLTDGRYGKDDYKQSLSENWQGWVGWRNDTRKGKPLEIKFEFDKVREFSAVHIVCNNQFTKEVQVFKEAKVYFSVGGHRYKGEPITYEYVEDRIFESSRNVTIKLHHRVGRFVKIRLEFAARWLLISEIMFDSTIVSGNVTEEEEDPEPALQDQIATPGIDKGNVVSAQANHGLGQYLGVVVGVLSVLAVLMIAAVIFIIIQQRRFKSSPRQSQIPSACDKAGLFREPMLDRSSGSPDYADVRDPEYAVPLQTPHTPRALPPPLQNFLPKPPSVPPPPERYYAATEICGTGFVPPPPPLSTPPPVRLSRQPRYVTNSRTYVGP